MQPGRALLPAGLWKRHQDHTILAMGKKVRARVGSVLKMRCQPFRVVPEYTDGGLADKEFLELV